MAFAGHALAQASALDERLLEAENIRSTTSPRFAELLKELREEVDSPGSSASKLQRQRLKYLQAYDLGVYKNKREHGIELAKQLIAETRDKNIRYRATALVANLAAINRRFATGLRYLDRTLKQAPQIADKNIRHEGLAVAATLYNEYGQPRIGLRYAEKVLRDQPNQRMQCVAGMFMIQSKYELGSLSKDDGDVRQVIDSCMAIGERMSAHFAKFTLARKMKREGRIDEGLGLMKASLEEVEGIGYERLTSEIHSIIAELKLAQGDIGAAESHARESIAVGGKVVSQQQLINSYKTLYQVAEISGRPAEALAMHKRYAAANLVREHDIKTRQLAYEIYKHQKDISDMVIADLQRKNMVMSLESELVSQRETKKTMALVLLMVALAALVFWSMQIKRHQNQLRRLAQTDMLTGIGNRHYFTRKSERALLDSARDGEVSALVMFDLDHFKAVNDTYGHGAGDWVLKQVGKTCAAHCRKVDYIGRLGGEEFAILLRGMDLAGATRIAEDCRSKFAQLDTRESGYSFVVTASFGVTSTAQSGYDLSRLLSHADQMLYRAKKEGRNRVCAYTADAAAEQRNTRQGPTLTVVGG
jgi:diguanylate cyclase (GGDEF)-like protein